jgi:uncharacterized protein (TIGR00369 family)
MPARCSAASAVFVPVHPGPGPWTIDEVRRAPEQGFQRVIGIELRGVQADLVSAVVRIGPQHLNSVGLVHGGVLLAIADSLGAMGAVQHLAPDQRTATLESKANFVRPAQGGLVAARCTKLHVGRRTSVWQTTIKNESGQLVAHMIQTQLHMSE